VTSAGLRDLRPPGAGPVTRSTVAVPNAGGGTVSDMTWTSDRPAARPPAASAVSLRGARLAYGDHVLWDGLDLDVAPGEFVAVLGPNGAGKTSLLRVLLGQTMLATGSVHVGGRPVQRGSSRIGYVPQQKSFDPGLPLRARDLVGFGVDGHRWGVPWPSRARRRQVDRALDEVGALAYADAPVGLLSGGEQQRLRIAQALITDPDVLLCDEPLLSLDLSHQRSVSELIDERRRATSTAVLFVTHEINPIMDKVDRVLYLANGRFRIGTPAEVMRTEVLSDLYQAHVEVVTVAGRLMVLGVEQEPHHHDSRHHR
jgi:zinc/manganese transport system ATP-binding protein